MSMTPQGESFFRRECQAHGVLHYSASIEFADETCPVCGALTINRQKQQVFDKEKGMVVVIGVDPF